MLLSPMTYVLGSETSGFPIAPIPFIHLTNRSEYVQSHNIDPAFTRIVLCSLGIVHISGHPETANWLVNTI